MTPMVVISAARDGMPKQILGFYPMTECTLAVDRLRAFLRRCGLDRHICLQIDIFNPRGLPHGRWWDGCGNQPPAAEANGTQTPAAKTVIPFPPLEPTPN